MGKGDQRTKRGKIVRGTFGKSRPQVSKGGSGKGAAQKGQGAKAASK